MRLTPTTIRALTLPSGVRDKTYWDDDLGGFGLRLRAGGSTRYVVQYDLGGKTKRITLGTTAMLDLGAARAKARDLLASVRLGGDPAAEKREAHERAAETFASLLPRYLAYQRARRRPRSCKELERHLLKYARGLHARPIASIDRRTVASLISTLTEKNGPTAAKTARASLAQYFTWLQREGLLDVNPVTHTNMPATNGARTRVLTDDELRTIWRALGDDDYGDIVRLLVYTAARRLEIGNLTFDEIDLDAAEIRLPAERCKNKRPHLIVLSEPALAILRRREHNGRTHVFGRGASGGFQGWSHRKRALDARLPDVKGWVLHDIRRLASTVMHDQLGIAPHVVEAVLAHVGHQSGVAGTYNLASYRDEKRRALEKWAAYVDAVVSGGKAAGKVIKLRRH